MLEQARFQHLRWLQASVIAAVSFYMVKNVHLPILPLVAWKGTGVALLAVWAFLHPRGPVVLRIGLVMALCAAGDVLLEWNQTAGAGAFLLAHLEAISLYLRNRRTATTNSQRLAALALLVLTPLLAWQLTGSLAVAVYASALGAMAACAWMSRFSRYRVGLGAALFVASDLLIFARMGVLADSSLPGLLIWPLYFLGVLLICTGVIDSLRTHPKPQ